MDKRLRLSNILLYVAAFAGLAGCNSPNREPQNTTSGQVPMTTESNPNAAVDKSTGGATGSGMAGQNAPGTATDKNR